MTNQKPLNVAKDLGITLNDMQKKAMNVLRWYAGIMQSSARTGRTTAMCLVAIEHALAKPGVAVRVVDHCPQTKPPFILKHLRAMIEGAPDNSIIKTRFHWTFTKDSFTAIPVEVVDMAETLNKKDFKRLFANLPKEGSKEGDFQRLPKKMPRKN